MDKKVIVVETTGMLESMRLALIKNFPFLEESLVFSNTFDGALEKVPFEGNVVVISSNMFHESKDPHFDVKKSADILAQAVKEINPSAQVYAFSAFPPREFEKAIDGYFEKDFYNADNQIVDIFHSLGLNQSEFKSGEPLEDKKIGRIKLMSVLFCLGILLIGIITKTDPKVCIPIALTPILIGLFIAFSIKRKKN